MATVMPRPMAAGVFGMARTTALGRFSALKIDRSVRPAMIDTTTVEGPIIVARGGSASLAMHYSARSPAQQRAKDLGPFQSRLFDRMPVGDLGDLAAGMTGELRYLLDVCSGHAHDADKAVAQLPGRPVRSDSGLLADQLECAAYL